MGFSLFGALLGFQELLAEQQRVTFYDDSGSLCLERK